MSALLSPRDRAALDRVVKGNVMADQFAEALRRLLNTPIAEPAYLSAVSHCKALLVIHDEDKEIAANDAMGVPR